MNTFFATKNEFDFLLTLGRSSRKAWPVVAKMQLTRLSQSTAVPVQLSVLFKVQVFSVHFSNLVKKVTKLLCPVELKAESQT